MIFCPIRLPERVHFVFGMEYERGAYELTDDSITIKSDDMTKTKIKPLADRVLVEPQEAETKTAGGIIIPDSAKEKPQRGKVIAVGPGTKDEKIEVKEGDLVLYGKYSGTEINVDGKDFLIMRQSDILAII